MTNKPDKRRLYTNVPSGPTCEGCRHRRGSLMLDPWCLVSGAFLADDGDGWGLRTDHCLTNARNR